ncbi:UxaA family hydrolase [Bacillus licheniformis]|nr:UxaA family hydrolase [Bacillus licheniformis]
MANAVNHPNAGGVLVLGLGCETTAFTNSAKRSAITITAGSSFCFPKRYQTKSRKASNC